MAEVPNEREGEPEEGSAGEGPTEESGLLPARRRERVLAELARAQIADAEARREEADVRRGELALRDRQLAIQEKEIDRSWDYADRQLAADERVQTNNTNKGLQVLWALLGAFLVFTIAAMATDNAPLAVQVIQAIIYGASGWIAGRAVERGRQSNPPQPPVPEE